MEWTLYAVTRFAVAVVATGRSLDLIDLQKTEEIRWSSRKQVSFQILPPSRKPDMSGPPKREMVSYMEACKRFEHLTPTEEFTLALTREPLHECCSIGETSGHAIVR